MERINRQREARQRYVVAWTQFIREYPKNTQYLFCFFEGPDDPRFYGSRIDQYISVRPKRFYVSKGKDGVLRISELIRESEEYKHAAVALFVDRDFDLVHPNDEAIYVTPCYSIENLYVSALVMEKVARDEFGAAFSAKGDEVAQIVSLWNDRLGEYLSVLEEIGYWLWKHRCLQETQGLRRLDLNNLNIQKYVKVDIGKVHSSLSFDVLDAIYPEAYKLSEQDLEEARKYFSGKTMSLEFRGKWIFECLRLFLQSLAADKNSERSVCFQDNGKVGLSLGRQNLMSVLSKYVETPACLKAYLEKLNQKCTPLLERQQA